jgi:peroxidase
MLFIFSQRLRDIFHNPLTLLANNTYDELMRGITAQPMQEFNNMYSTEMVDHLFEEKDQDGTGVDIVALNVQRGRDHQMPSYPAFR